MAEPAFLERPRVEWIRDHSSRVRLASPLRFRDDRGRIWHVPRGTVTDLASVPRIVPGLVRVLLPSKLESALAAILHDWLYATASVSRREADRLFWLALRVAGEGRVGSWLMWAGVRAGGWLAWRRHRG